MVANAVVKFHARLHGGQHVLLVPVLADGRVDVFGGLVGRAESGQREQLNGDAHRAQLLAREQRRGTEFGDVREHRHLHRVHELLVRGQVVRGFREDAVRARFHASNGAFNGRVHAFRLNGIRARNDEEVRIRLRIRSGLHAVRHFVLRNNFLARTMPTALRAHLVFNMAGRSARLDERLDGAFDVEGRRPEARVDVHQQRQVAHVRDAPDVDEHVVHGVDAEVRQAQRARGHATTREIDGLVAGTLGQQGVVGVDGTDHLKGLFGGQGSAEARAGGSRLGHGLSFGELVGRVCQVPRRPF